MFQVILVEFKLYTYNIYVINTIPYINILAFVSIIFGISN